MLVIKHKIHAQLSPDDQLFKIGLLSRTFGLQNFLDNIEWRNLAEMQIGTHLGKRVERGIISEFSIVIQFFF